MKNLIQRRITLVLIPLFIFSCSKVDWNDVWGNHPSQPKCDVAAYTLNIYPQVTHPFLFAKTYNNRGQVKTIDASFFNVRSPEYLIHFRLRVESRGKNIYLVNMDAPYDTSMTIRLNKYGKPESAIGVEDLGSYEFFYTNNRLSTYNWNSQGSYLCQYDDQGNIISISYPGGDGYFFSYDLSKKAKQQFYMDELRMRDDGMALMQYLGLFPELVPVNLRTRASLGNTITGYYWDRVLRNHQLDKSGKLMQYDIASCNLGICDPQVITAKLEWNCR